MKIAVSGKGGVGKTFIAGGIACFLVRKGFKTIAIDADPSPNLGLTLGLSFEEARKILPISENKELLEAKTGTGYSGVFRLSFSVDDIVRDYSVRTPFGVNLLVMGTVRSMGSGCTCPANAVIRALLRHLIVERDEAVIVDMEAGIEHIGRGTAQHVDIMLIIVDAGLKTLEIAKNIHDLSSKAGLKQIFLIGNKIENDIQKTIIEDFAEKNKLKILGFVPFDQKIIEAEIHGETPLKSRGSKAVQAIEVIGNRLITDNAYNIRAN